MNVCFGSSDQEILLAHLDDIKVLPRLKRISSDNTDGAGSAVVHTKESGDPKPDD
jgi:hypothetical protein